MMWWWLLSDQWHWLHRAWRHVPPLLQMVGHGGTVSRKALTKTCLYSLKSGKHDKKILYICPPAHFQIRSGATVAERYDSMRVSVERIRCARTKTNSWKNRGMRLNFKGIWIPQFNCSLCNMADIPLPPTQRMRESSKRMHLINKKVPVWVCVFTEHDVCSRA